MCRTLGSTILMLAFFTPMAFAQQVANGEAVYKAHCASCHSQITAGAPNIETLRQLTPEAIVTSLNYGRMTIQGFILTDNEKRTVAEFLAGRTIGPPQPPSTVNRCAITPAMADPARGPSWNGWGNGPENTRQVKAGGLTAADLPRLKLKWAFGYAGIDSARAQPAVAGGRLFVASENSEVHALDPKTGCLHWTFRAQAGVRTALSVGTYTNAGRNGYAVFFGDSRANAYAVDANSGQPIWVRKVDDHRAAGITGAPTYHNGRLYVPVQGIGEEGQGARLGYECCTFRGSISALDANTGTVLWKRYTIEEARPRERNKEGVQTWGPAGGGIWSSPTIDAARNLVYVAVGNNYAEPSQPTTDAVMALDLPSGTVKWVRQVTSNDTWAFGCPAKSVDNPNCPAVRGPDHDLSSSPALSRVNGRDLLVLAQKSGMGYALDPDSEGAVVWTYRFGQGSAMGGQYGVATDERQAYFGVADLLTKQPGGIRAVNLATGEQLWSTEPQTRLCAPAPTCRAGQGAAVTAIPGAVLSGSLDGGLRAYSATDGSVIWQFDTNREFNTINGVKAKGGGLDGPGPIVVDAMLYVNSGYGGFIGNPGNVLLAFGLD